MSNIIVPVPTLEQFKEFGDKYDKSYLKLYYGNTRCRKMNPNDPSRQGKNNGHYLSNEKTYLEGFDQWLNSNFIKTPSWLSRVWRDDPDYKPVFKDSRGLYYEFEVPELEWGEGFSSNPKVTANDITHGKVSLKDMIKNSKDGGGTLVKMSNGKWRVYLNKASAPKGGAGNVASTTSTDSNTGTTSSTDSTSSTSSTDSTSSTSSTTTTDSTTGTSSTTSTDTSSTTSTDSTTTRSFDFLDDVLGTQKESSKDKATDLDPNQVANAIVSDTKLNDTAISSLVSTYLSSLHRINRSYNTQTK